MGIPCFFVWDTWGYYLFLGGDTWGYLGIPGDTWGYLGIPGGTYLVSPLKFFFDMSTEQLYRTYVANVSSCTFIFCYLKSSQTELH